MGKLVRHLAAICVVTMTAGCGGGGGGGAAAPSDTASPGESSAQSVVFSGAVSSFTSPVDVARDAAGNVYVVDESAHALYRTSPTGGTVVMAGRPGVAGAQDGRGADARFYQPKGVAVDAVGNVYVSDRGNRLVRRVAPDGTVTTLAGSAMLQGYVDAPGASARFGDPYGIAVDGNGTVYVADPGNKAVRIIRPDGAMSSWGLANGVSLPVDVALGPDHRVYVLDSGRVMVWDPRSQTFLPALLLPHGPLISQGLAVQSDGALLLAATHWVGGLATGQVYRHAPYFGDWTDTRWDVVAGMASKSGSANGPAASASFRVLAGIEAGPGGQVIVADPENGAVRVVDAAGQVGALPGTAMTAGFADGTSGQARFSHPWDLVLAQDGSTLLVTDYYNNAVRKVQPDGSVTTFAGQGPDVPVTGAFGNTMLFPTSIARIGDKWRVLSLNANSLTHFGTMTNFMVLNGDAFGLLDVKSSYWEPMRYFAAAPDGMAYVADVRAIYKEPFGSASTPLLGANLPSVPSVLGEVRGLAVDSKGNLFAADRGKNVIWRITPSGEASIFAGQEYVYGHQDGTGGDALFWGVRQLAMDAADNLLVVHDGPLRRVSPQGVVTTPSLAWGTPVLQSIRVIGGRLYGTTGNAVLRMDAPR